MFEAPGFHAEVLGFLPPPPPHVSPEILPHDVIITSTATIGYTKYSIITGLVYYS